MANEEIIGGLRFAVKKGESLQHAMTTFLNAGYPKNEIEEAARIIHQEIIQAPFAGETNLDKKSENNLTPQPGQIISKNVSSYEQKPKKKAKKAVVIILIILAMLVIGIGILFLLSDVLGLF